MRRIRRLTAVTLSFVLIMGMCLPVLADETQESPADPEAAVSLEEAADETDVPDEAALPEGEEAADASIWAPGASEEAAAEPGVEEELSEEPDTASLNGAENYNISYASIKGLKSRYLSERDNFWDYDDNLIDGKNYRQGAWLPSFEVVKEGKTLELGKDYTAQVYSYGPEPTLTITGIGDYYGSQEIDLVVDSQMSVSGKNRYYTAINLAASIITPNSMYCDLSEVVVVKGTDFPDALSANAYAGISRAPLILTTPDKLHEAASKFLSGEFQPFPSYSDERIDVSQIKKVTVIGGDLDGAIKDIKKLRPDVTVKVIAGKNRYKTAEEVCKAVIKKKQAAGEALDSVFIATGAKAADSLSASSWSYKYHIPILLAKNGVLADSGKTLAAKFKTAYLLGSTETVKDSAAPSGVKKVRLGGKNRYRTSEEIAKYFIKNYVDKSKGLLGAFFAYGADDNYPDALAAGQVSSAVTGPVVLVNEKNLAPSYLKSYYPTGPFSYSSPEYRANFVDYLFVGYVKKGKWSGYQKLINSLKQ